METSVKIYVYDLSNGMARQLSLQLTGRQIDGIWHTSVVVFGREVFYGQGINSTQPGQSHHGSPLQIIDMGETSIDEETFNEYISEMKEHYTADKYHLLDFNCNSFTNDCVGFLTGRSIPAFIKDLPADFLSTPFGTALRPTIDAMYRRPSPSAIRDVPAATASSPNLELVGSILQSVASQASSGGTTGSFAPVQEKVSLTSPMYIITNPPSFHSFLKNHLAAVAFFTSQTCPPCKMVEPVFELLSKEKCASSDRKNGAGFAKVDIGVGLGRNLAAQLNISATPTFLFFLNGKQVSELKGVDVNELRTQVDLLLFQAYPPHPHTALSLPAVHAISLKPILFAQVPAIDTIVSKLSMFIDEASWPESLPQNKSQIKQIFSITMSSYLKARFITTNGVKSASLSATPALLSMWSHATALLVSTLPIESVFPAVDCWRLAFLDPAVGTWSASCLPASDPFTFFIPKTIEALQKPMKSARNYVLTSLRLLSNSFSNAAQAARMLSGEIRQKLIEIIVPALLHEDALVRTAAASLAFNAATELQKCRNKTLASDEEDWEVEMVSAIVEAIDREKDSEEVVHRLTASLALLLWQSPCYDTQLQPLLEVLQSKQILQGKLVKGPSWSQERGIEKKETRKLVEEVADKLCR